VRQGGLFLDLSLERHPRHQPPFCRMSFLPARG